MTTTTIIALYIAGAGLFLAGWAWMIRRRNKRFSPNDRYADKDLDEGWRGVHPDDGVPGGKRRRIWTEKERKEYRRARQRRKMRVVQ